MENKRAMWLVKSAGAGALTVLLAVPAFAQTRTDGWQGQRGANDVSRRDSGAAQTARSSDQQQGYRNNSNAQQTYRNADSAQRDRGTSSPQQYRDHASQPADRNESSQSYRNNDAVHTSRSNDAGRSYRDNERVSAQGRVTSFTHERDGYRVQLEGRHESYWVPQSYFRDRSPRVGISINLGGIFRGGSVYVDAVNWDGGAYGYGRDLVTGVVERVDFRSGIAEIRDQRTGRDIRTDLRSIDPRGRLGMDDVRRGDYVELSGSWAGGIFDAYRIDALRQR